MPGAYDTSHQSMEEEGMLHCLSPGVCSGNEAALGRGESAGGGTATPCKVWPVKMYLVQDLTLVISGELQ